jgi:hypothetical protein
MGAVMARRHPRCGASGAGSGGAMEICGDTAGAHLTEDEREAVSLEGTNQKGKRTSANTPPTRGLAGPARLNLAHERREASGAGWAEGQVGR